jgi:hypothetical protein
MIIMKKAYLFCFHILIFKFKPNKKKLAKLIYCPKLNRERRMKKSDIQIHDLII